MLNDGAHQQPAQGIPASVASLPVNLVGVALMFALLYAFSGSIAEWDGPLVAAAAAFCCVAPALARDVKTIILRRPPPRHEADTGRVAIKILGLGVTLGLFGVALLGLPYYRDLPLGFFKLYAAGAALALAGAWWYMRHVDARMEKPEDGYYHLGLVALGRWRGADAGALGRHVAEWTVKFIFLPIMLTQFIISASEMAQLLVGGEGGLLGWYALAYAALYCVDVAFAAVGYAMTFRATDSHVRAVDPSPASWLVCLACYPPFWSLWIFGFMAYDDGLYWNDWLSGHPAVMAAWAAAILACLAVYALTTVCFGYRFSNLTYRGLISNGPYRYSKHPAYISKNLSWWLISMPFLSATGAGEAIWLSLGLLGVNAVYFLRARMEERFLARYSEYDEYARWIDERGVFAWAGRVLPYLRYDPERRWL